MDRTIAAVIVTFNRLEKLGETLQNTLAEPFEAVVVVNNCSTDGTAEWLDEQGDPRLHVIHSPKNVGGAGGFNLGFDYAATRLPEVAWLVAFDDDAYPAPGSITAFKSLEIPAEVGSLAAAVYYPDGSICEMNRTSYNPFWHLKELVKTAFTGRSGFHVVDADYDRDTTMPIDASSFVGFFLRLSLVRDGKAGLPRTELFIYADDIIYNLELRKAGIGHLFCPQVRFIHDCQSLINKEGVCHDLWKAYFVTRNRVEMYRQAAGIFFPFVMVVKIPVFFLMARFYEPGRKRGYLRVARKAIWHGMTRNFSWSIDQVREFTG